MTVRKRRNLGELPDFVLGPDPIPMVAYWMHGGPSEGTMVHVPVGTQTVYAAHPPAEVGLSPRDCEPRVAVYEVDPNSASGGFNVFRYARSVPLNDPDPSR